MSPENPIFGAGVQMFEAAVNEHLPGMTPHVAHNTFLNFSVNTGLVTGVIFLLLIYGSLVRFRALLKSKLSLNKISLYALACSSIAIFGFFVCSMFLDLVIFEPFYIALAINLCAWHVSKDRIENTV